LLVSPVSTQTGVEYGIIGSKSAPSSNMGRTLEGRFKSLPEQAPTSSTKPGVVQRRLEAPLASGTSEKPKKFTIYSSEGTQEITIEPSSHDAGNEKQ